MLQALQAVNWAVEEDHEMGLDEVPTRLNNPTDNSEPDHSNTNSTAPSGNKETKTGFNKTLKLLMFKLNQKFSCLELLVEVISTKCFLNCKCL